MPLTSHVRIGKQGLIFSGVLISEASFANIASASAEVASLDFADLLAFKGP